MKIQGRVDQCNGKYFTKDEFIGCCEDDFFINDHGEGFYTLNGLVTTVEVKPTDIIAGFNDEFDGVIWFEK